MTFQDEKPKTDAASESTRSLLKFTCPECGGNNVEEIVLTRREIDEVYDPCDPDYDGSNDWGEYIVTARSCDSVMNDGNMYRCNNCEMPLTEEQGDTCWGGEFLVKWLRANCKQEDS